MFYVLKTGIDGEEDYLIKLLAKQNLASIALFLFLSNETQDQNLQQMKASTLGKSQVFI